jgi:acetyl-CoA acyltransferase
MTRVAVVAGVRTPFVKRGTVFRDLTAHELGAMVVDELLARSGVAVEDVERLVFGQVAPDLTGPNIAREIVLASNLRPETDAHSVARACTTSYRTVIDAATSIRVGEIDAAIAGGADSASDVPIAVSKPLARTLVELSRARGVGAWIRALKDLRPRDLVPEPPGLVERSTGLTMGESAEKMAQINGVSRPEQDEYAHRSHVLAAAAWTDGRFAGDVMPVRPDLGLSQMCTRDNMVRMSSTIDDYARLSPVFDRDGGTITAGNSSPLTDGASAVLLMREDKAVAMGLEPLGYLVSHAFTALDPRGQMLMGPAYTIPLALERAGLELGDLDLIDLHEAFAAQVLSVTQALESRHFAEAELGRSAAVGRIDWDRFNVMGGSIALGHPFAATGTRQIAQVLRELRRRGGGLALCSACAAGGLGAAIVLQVD